MDDLTKDKTDFLLNLVNSSGFIFQVGVRREIERTSNDHAWSVLSQECRWQHPEQDSSGFVDLVLEHPSRHLRIVIECKRAAGRDWVFLTPKDKRTSSKKISSFWILSRGSDQRDQSHYAWIDPDANPASPESAFCIVQGQEDGKTPMLERIADILLPATEALALKYLREKPLLQRFYFPVIVTNANLYTCEFDPGDINVRDGRLSEGKGIFQSANVVRFRKSLANTCEPSKDLQAFEALNNKEEQTVLVMNAASLSEILKQFDLAPHSQLDYLISWLNAERRE
jgi:hypothetical protein